MTALLTEPRFQRTTHLVELIADAERLAATLAAAPEASRAPQRQPAHDLAALASLHLDGSTLKAVPAPAAVDDIDLDAIGDTAIVAEETDRPGTWLDAMGNRTEVHDEAIEALEFLGVQAALASDDLAGRLLTDPLPALSELHRRLVRGLLDADRAGQPRRSEQAVHDASLGRIIFFPTEPADIPGELATLGAWMMGAGVREHGIIASGVLHHAILRIHPFEAANGRLARTAARLILRHRGLDPDGLGRVESVLDEDRLDYHDEVRRTVQRRDLTIALERWAEAVSDGLRGAARELDLLAPVVPERAVRFLAGRGPFTIADLRADAELSPEESRADLGVMLDAGLIRRVPGSRGLRFTVA